LIDRLRTDAFGALLGAEWRMIQSNRSSDFANLMLTDLARVGMGLQALLTLSAGLSVMLAYALVAVGISPAMTCIAFGSGAILFSLLGAHRRAALDLGWQLGAGNRAVHGNLHEALAGMKLAKILGNERRHLDAFTRVIADLRQRQIRYAVSSGLAGALFSVGGALFIAGFVYLGLKVLGVHLAELFTLVIIFARIMPLWSRVQQQLQQLLHAAPALIEAKQLHAQCLAHREPVLVEVTRRRPILDAIRVEQVGYRYAEREGAALADIDLIIEPRTTTAVIGASGSGKSTLADLLMGLMEPTNGRILVDDRPLIGPERIAWRRSVAYVPQETFLFDDSIRNNLLWARPGASEPQLIAALERAAADFVLQFPDGLDTRVGERGTRLSGGERQRIALARALLSAPLLLILDEATSALDLASEERVRRAIEALHGDLTLVVIGHRLATLRHADQVVALNMGKLIAAGTWQQTEQRLTALGMSGLIASPTAAVVEETKAGA
jgi:ATP-binding cassette subfamily C protein